MSNRTQQEGRTLYTEREFDFKPRWSVDLLERMNAVWLNMLFWETRRFDPTFDHSTKRDAMDGGGDEGVDSSYVPSLVFDTMPVITAPYNGTVEWTLTGKVTNYSSKHTYSPVAITVSIDGNAPVNGTALINPDGTFTYVPEGAAKENVTGDIIVTGSVLGNGNASNTASTVIRMKLIPVDPVIGVTVDPTDIIATGEFSGEPVHVTGNVAVPAPATLRILVAVITNEDGSQSSVVIPVNPDGSFSTDLPNPLFKRGKNTVEFKAVSVLNGHTSSATVFGPIIVNARQRPDVPAVIIDPVVTVAIGSDVKITGRVLLGADTTVKNATLLGLDQDYPLTVNEDGSFEFIYPADKTVLGTKQFTVDAIVTRDELDSDVGTGASSYTVRELPVASGITMHVDPTNIDLDDARQKVTVSGEVTSTEPDFKIESLKLTINGVEAKNVRISSDHTYSAIFPNTAFVVGPNVLIATAVISSDGLRSDPLTVTGGANATVTAVENASGIKVNAPATVDLRYTDATVVISGFVTGEVIKSVTIEIGGVSYAGIVVGETFRSNIPATAFALGENLAVVNAVLASRNASTAVTTRGVMTPAAPIIELDVVPADVFENGQRAVVITGSVKPSDEDSTIDKATIVIGAAMSVDIVPTDTGTFSFVHRFFARFGEPLNVTVNAVAVRDSLKSVNASKRTSVTVKKATSNSVLKLKVDPSGFFLVDPVTAVASLNVELVGGAVIKRVRMKAGIMGFNELPVAGTDYTYDIDPHWLVEGPNNVVAEVTTFVDGEDRVLTAETSVTMQGALAQSVATVVADPVRVPQGKPATVEVSGEFITDSKDVVITSAKIKVNGVERPLTFTGTRYFFKLSNTVVTDPQIVVTVESSLYGKPQQVASASTTLQIYGVPLEPTATIKATIAEAILGSGGSFAVTGTLNTGGFDAGVSELYLNGELVNKVTPKANWASAAPYAALVEGINTLTYKFSAVDGQLSSTVGEVSTSVIGIVRTPADFDFTITPSPIPVNGTNATVNGTVNLRDGEAFKSVEVSLGLNVIPTTITGNTFTATIPANLIQVGRNTVKVVVNTGFDLVDNPSATKSRDLVGIGKPEAPEVTLVAMPNQVVADGTGENVIVNVKYSTGVDIELESAWIWVGDTQFTNYTVVDANNVRFTVANALFKVGGNNIVGGVKVKRYDLVSDAGTGSVGVLGIGRPAVPTVTLVATPARVGIGRPSEKCVLTIGINREVGSTNKTVELKIRGVVKPVTFGPNDNQINVPLDNDEFIVGNNAIAVSVVVTKNNIDSAPGSKTTTVTGVAIPVVASITTTLSQSMIAINYPSVLGTSGTVNAPAGSALKSVIVKVGSFSSPAALSGMNFTMDIPSDKFVKGANTITFTAIVTKDGFESDPFDKTETVEGVTELNAPVLTLVVPPTRPTNTAWTCTGTITGPKGTLPSQVSITTNGFTRPVTVLNTDGTFTHNILASETAVAGNVEITASGTVDLDGLISPEGTVTQTVSYVSPDVSQQFIFVPGGADNAMRIHSAVDGQYIQRIAMGGPFTHISSPDGLWLVMKSQGVNTNAIVFRFSGVTGQFVEQERLTDISAETGNTSFMWGAFTADSSRILITSAGQTSNSGRYPTRAVLFDVSTSGFTRLADNKLDLTLNSANANGFPIAVNADGTRWLWPISMTTSNNSGWNRIYTYNGTDTLTNSAGHGSATYPPANLSASFMHVYYNTSTPAGTDIFVPSGNTNRALIYNANATSSRMAVANTNINSLVRIVPTPYGGWVTLQNSVMWKYFKNDTGGTNGNMTAPTGIGTVNQTIAICPDPLSVNNMIALVSVNNGNNTFSYKLARISFAANGTAFGAGTIIATLEGLPTTPNGFNLNTSNITSSK